MESRKDYQSQIEKLIEEMDIILMILRNDSIARNAMLRNSCITKIEEIKRQIGELRLKNIFFGNITLN